MPKMGLNLSLIGWSGWAHSRLNLLRRAHYSSPQFGRSPMLVGVSQLTSSLIGGSGCFTMPLFYSGADITMESFWWAETLREGACTLAPVRSGLTPHEQQEEHNSAGDYLVSQAARNAEIAAPRISMDLPDA